MEEDEKAIEELDYTDQQYYINKQDEECEGNGLD
jgi:hypothetical protein